MCIFDEAWVGYHSYLWMCIFDEAWVGYHSYLWMCIFDEAWVGYHSYLWMCIFDEAWVGYHSYLWMCIFDEAWVGYHSYEIRPDPLHIDHVVSSTKSKLPLCKITASTRNWWSTFIEATIDQTTHKCGQYAIGFHLGMFGSMRKWDEYLDFNSFVDMLFGSSDTICYLISDSNVIFILYTLWWKFNGAGIY